MRGKASLLSWVRAQVRPLAVPDRHDAGETVTISTHSPPFRSGR